MRFLHTADWHVGKTLRGRSRADEHRAVLGEIATIADERAVDTVLVAGDLFETAAPSPESEQIVYQALLALSKERPVVVVAGNHDNPRRLQAVQPLLGLANVRVLDAVARPDKGGVLTLKGKSGEQAHIVLLPFVSQRGIVRADQLMNADADQHAGQYADRMAGVLAALCAGVPPDGVNLVVAHAMVHGGKMGGGERTAHTVFAYSVPGSAFPSHFHYVALGHLHRQQRIDGACPIHYSGSPLQLDFGETADAKSVNVIEAVAGKPANVELVPLSCGKRLRKVSGTLAELKQQASRFRDDFLSVEVQEDQRPGLGDDVRQALPNAVDVRLPQPKTTTGPTADQRQGSPQGLFRRYLKEKTQDDAEVRKLFADLLDEVLAENHAS